MFEHWCGKGDAPDFDRWKDTWSDFGPKKQCADGKWRVDIRRSGVQDWMALSEYKNLQAFSILKVHLTVMPYWATISTLFLPFLTFLERVVCTCFLHFLTSHSYFSVSSLASTGISFARVQWLPYGLHHGPPFSSSAAGLLCCIGQCWSLILSRHSLLAWLPCAIFSLHSMYLSLSLRWLMFSSP